MVNPVHQDNAPHRLATNWIAAAEPVEGLEIPTFEDLLNHRAVMPDCFPNRTLMTNWLQETFDLTRPKAMYAAFLCWPSYSRFVESVHPKPNAKRRASA